MSCCPVNRDVIDDTTFYERQLNKIPIDSLRPSNVFCTDGFSQAINRASSSGKRAFDIVASGLMIIVTLPIMLLTAVIILFISGGHGTVIYRQIRVGRNGELFEMYKFRSMCEDAESKGNEQWATVNDERVTSVGKFIRATRIDELPQLFNVLSGSMSFVGPGVPGLSLPDREVRHAGAGNRKADCEPHGRGETKLRVVNRYIQTA